MEGVKYKNNPMQFPFNTSHKTRFSKWLRSLQSFLSVLCFKVLCGSGQHQGQILCRAQSCRWVTHGTRCTADEIQPADQSTGRGGSGWSPSTGSSVGRGTSSKSTAHNHTEMSWRVGSSILRWLPSPSDDHPGRHVDQERPGDRDELDSASVICFVTKMRSQLWQWPAVFRLWNTLESPPGFPITAVSTPFSPNSMQFLIMRRSRC